MKIAVLSDIHEGINRKKTETDIFAILKESLLEQVPDVFILSGDITAGPDKSLNLLKRLQSELPKIQILYVHGNHDVYHEDSRVAYHTLMKFQGNLGHGPVHLNSEWVVIGDGGWYDYSFGEEEFTNEEFTNGRFDDFTWPDKIHANWFEKDEMVAEKYVVKLDAWLAEHQHKNIIMVSHFVPFKHFVQVKNEPAWDFFNAMMGSSGFGALAEKYGVKKLVFGHIHTRYHEEYRGIDCICNPLGYFPHEWTSELPQQEISSTMKIIEI